MPDFIRRALCRLASPRLGPFIGLTGIALCATLLIMETRQTVRDLDLAAARVFALADAFLPEAWRRDQDGAFAAVNGAVILTPPFVASRLVAGDGRIAVSGDAAAFDEPTGLLLPGYPYARYAERIVLRGSQAARLEILADSRPLAARLAWRCLFFLLLSAALIWFSSVLAHAQGPPEKDASPEAQKAPAPPRPQNNPDDEPEEIRAVMPLRLRPLAPLFMKTAFDNARRMRAALSQEDFEEVRRLGHTLKGAARTYGLSDLGERGFEVELKAQEKDAAGLTALLDALDDVLSRTRIYFEEGEKKDD